MPSISVPAAIAIGGGLSAAGGVAASVIGSSQAAGAASDAAAAQRGQYNTTLSTMFPFFGPAYNSLQGTQQIANAGPTGGMPDYVGQAAANVPLQMTQAQLEATPGYQFDLSQGLKATQSAAAARGLGVSGASLKGAGSYATGLANKTYLDQFNVGQKRFEDYLNLNTGAQGNVTNQFNRLNAIATLGENAAAQTGAQGTALANQAGNYINQAGLASAAGTTGASNALTGSLNNYLAYNQMQNYLNPKTGGYDAVGNAYSAPNTPQAWAAQQGVY